MTDESKKNNVTEKELQLIAGRATAIAQTISDVSYEIGVAILETSMVMLASKFKAENFRKTMERINNELLNKVTDPFLADLKPKH